MADGRDEQQVQRRIIVRKRGINWGKRHRKKKENCPLPGGFVEVSWQDGQSFHAALPSL